jgi:hypothetical protein
MELVSFERASEMRAIWQLADASKECELFFTHATDLVGFVVSCKRHLKFAEVTFPLHRSNLKLNIVMLDSTVFTK